MSEKGNDEVCESSCRKFCDGNYQECDPAKVYWESTNKREKYKSSRGHRIYGGEEKRIRELNLNNVWGGNKMETRRNESKRDGKREVTPIETTLRVARQITTRKPKEEQPDLYSKLVEAIKEVEEDYRSKLFFRLAGEVVRGETPVQGLFVVGREVRMSGIVHHVATLAKAVREEMLSTEDLRAVGLAEVKANFKGTKSWTTYKFGLEAFRAAVPKLKELGKCQAEKILRDHVLKSEDIKAHNKAKRVAQAAYREATKNPQSLIREITEKTTPEETPKQEVV